MVCIDSFRLQTMTAFNNKFGSSKKNQKMMKKNAKKVDKNIFGM
jgi:hypothetical protein